ncbi:MAG: universal stress protein [Bdellovibrionales bacterium]|nr:universal stress protein [Bdellovibrionales bacterium]
MIRSILVPIDGSPASDAALSISCSISCLIDARVIGLFVQDADRFKHVPLASALAASIGAQPAIEAPLPPAKLLEAEENVEAESLDLFQEFQSHCDQARTRSRFLCRRGNPAEEISEMGRSVDLIVIGNCGRHIGVEHKESGLTTNAVLHNTTRPVLVVPEEPAGLSRLVVAYDGSSASERVLRAAAELASVMRLEEVHIVTVGEDVEKARGTQRSAVLYLSNYEFLTVPALFRGDPKQVIPDYAEEVDASILALGAFGSGKIAERIFGSTTLVALQQPNVGILLSS